MVSLAATIAYRRIYYPRPVAHLPDILMIDIPRRFASKRLPTGRFYPILVETIEEQAELDAFLKQERDSLVPLDLFDRRPSRSLGDHLTIAQYGPSQSGWPFIQLCQWPAEFAAKASRKRLLLARGAYSFELFRNRKRLEQASKSLLASLDRRNAVKVEIVLPDWSGGPCALPS